MFLAYHSMKRQSGGKPIKGFEIWMENVSNVTVGDIDSPKATNTEA
jgi:hypothetical protein